MLIIVKKLGVTSKICDLRRRLQRCSHDGGVSTVPAAAEAQLPRTLEDLLRHIR